MKSIEQDYRKGIDSSKKSTDLYKQLNKLDSEMSKIEADFGKKYVDRFNDARLDDISYSKTKEVGRKMLETYGKSYRIRKDGTIIRGESTFDGIVYDYDKKYQYTRPHNL